MFFKDQEICSSRCCTWWNHVLRYLSSPFLSLDLKIIS